MDKREMAREFSDRARRLRASSGTKSFADEALMNESASEALFREAEREEKETKKVTLAEQEDAVVYANTAGVAGGRDARYAAANTLRRLREEGPQRIAALELVSLTGTAAWLKDLGVEPLK